MSETCRCGDEVWWSADGSDHDTVILCETCGGWEELDSDGYCHCGHCRTGTPIEPVQITVTEEWDGNKKCTDEKG